MWIGVVTEEVDECAKCIAWKLHLIEPRKDGQTATEWLGGVAGVPSQYDHLDTPILCSAMWALWLGGTVPLGIPMVMSIFEVPEGSTVVGFLNATKDRSWEDDAVGDAYVRVNYGNTIRTIAAVFPTKEQAEATIPDDYTGALFVPPENQRAGLNIFAAGKVAPETQDTEDTSGAQEGP